MPTAFPATIGALMAAATLTFRLPWQVSSSRLPLTRFLENEVNVEVFVERDATGQSLLGATFTPLRAHFHLYSKDLPRDGVRGVGRPTVFEIGSPTTIEPTGPLVANRPTRNLLIRPLRLRLPVYPEGPVTLTLPVGRSSGNDAKATELLVTYMACSEHTCFPPVINKRVSVTIPDSMIR